MPNIKSNALIKCPFFKKQNEKEKNVLFCCPVFDGQLSTKLIFNNEASKISHLENFCATGFYRGCPIAIACTEKYELEELNNEQNKNDIHK